MDKEPINNCTNSQDNVGYSVRHNNRYNCNTNNFSNIISYDNDGAMIWNGKRCESTPCSPKEQKELEELLSDFKVDSIE